MKDEMDILREVSSIAAGHGSAALSDILGRKITLEMPTLDIIPAKLIAGRINPEQIVVSVSSNILCGLKGVIFFILDEKSAFKLIERCYKSQINDKKTGLFTEMGFSVIKEIGNVIISSYAGAIGMILHTVVVPSIPTLVSGSIAQVMNMLIYAYSQDAHILLAEAEFGEPEEKILGTFYLILDDEAMRSIQNGCKKLLESVKK